MLHNIDALLNRPFLFLLPTVFIYIFKHGLTWNGRGRDVNPRATERGLEGRQGLGPFSIQPLVARFQLA